MPDLTRLRTPMEVCEAVARSSRGTATAQQIYCSRPNTQPAHFWYGQKLAIFIWHSQTRPPQSVRATAQAWGLSFSFAERVLQELDAEAAVDPTRIMNDTWAALWPEHPHYRGGPTHG